MCVWVIRVIVRSAGFPMYRSLAAVLLCWAAAQVLALPVCTDMSVSAAAALSLDQALRSEEHTSELQSL